jgi:hypothetical protein
MLCRPVGPCTSPAGRPTEKGSRDGPGQGTSPGKGRARARDEPGQGTSPGQGRALPARRRARALPSQGAQSSGRWTGSISTMPTPWPSAAWRLARLGRMRASRLPCAPLQAIEQACCRCVWCFRMRDARACVRVRPSRLAWVLGWCAQSPVERRGGVREGRIRSLGTVWHPSSRRAISLDGSLTSS